MKSKEFNEELKLSLYASVLSLGISVNGVWESLAYHTLFCILINKISPSVTFLEMSYKTQFAKCLHL